MRRGRAVTDPDRSLDPDEYTATALHFEVARLPPLLIRHLPSGSVSLLDLGSGDGPLFGALTKGGHIAPPGPVYAVDLETSRLARVASRFPWITTIVASADAIPEIADRSVEVVCSTMVMEHVPDERRYLDEIHRVLCPGGIAYVTTVFKTPWAWYFRKRGGESVLDTSHVREYTDLEAFRTLVGREGRFDLVELERDQLWFPLLDPLLFRVGGRLPAVAGRSRALRVLRAPRVPIPGYYSLGVVLRRAG